jgi:hypothetical protein
VRYRRNQTTLGSAGNHDAAIREARGKYITFLNHDDLFEPEFLSKLVPPLEADPSLVLSFCDHHVIDAHGALLKEETDRTTRQWKRDLLSEGTHRPFDLLLLNQSIPLAMGTVFRKDKIPQGGIPVEAGPAYDLWITYALCATRGGAYYVRDRLSRWRVHPASQTSRAGRAWARGSAYCWAQIAGDSSLVAIREQAIDKSYWAFRGAAVNAIKSGNGFAALRLGFRALQARRRW